MIFRIRNMLYSKVTEVTICFTLFSVELDTNSREVGGELYCLRCHDTMGIPICGACHRPIEERVVTALGKNWHVEVWAYHWIFTIAVILSWNRSHCLLFLFHWYSLECVGLFLLSNNFKVRRKKNLKNLQHFVCAVCEKPFLGHRHYEKKGLAYCEQHYHKVSFSTIQW